MASQSVHIKITKLSPDDWQKYRDLRLLALKSDPNAFGSSFEEEVNLTEADWRRRIDVMWFAVIDNDSVGLIGLLQCENTASKHCGHIVSLWVKPELRKRGIAKNLLQEVQAIAPSLGIRKLSLHVTLTQLAARNLYESLGFEVVAKLRDNLFKEGRYLDEYLMEWIAN